MKESIWKRIWNYSITVGQLIMTAMVMALIGFGAWLLYSIFRPSKD